MNFSHFYNGNEFIAGGLNPYTAKYAVLVLVLKLNLSAVPEK